MDDALINNMRNINEILNRAYSFGDLQEKMQRAIMPISDYSKFIFKIPDFASIAIKDYSALLHNIPDFTNIQKALDYNSLFDKKVYRTIADIGKIPKSLLYIDELNFQNKLYTTLSRIQIEDIIEEEIELLPTAETEPLNPSGIILLDEAVHVKGLITDIYKDPELIYSINPRDFEKMIAEILRKQGYEVTLTKQTRDGGMDIIAVQRLGNQEPLKFLYECKRWGKKQPVDIDVIRAFMYVIDKFKVNRGIIATSSYFTRDAKKERELFQPWRLSFADNAHVMTWVKQYLGKI